jgi:CheY-like chemotaxis protein
MGDMLRLLIVDDDRDFRRVARALLEGRFQVVGEAASVAEAEAAVTRSAPDVVLLDVNLPDGDGFSLAGSLARTAPAVRVVLTSSADLGDDGAVAASGAAAFIPKADLDAATLSRLVDAG